MGLQDGSIRSDIVSYKLTKNRPASRSVSQGVSRVINVSAITETACASEGVQELLIGLKLRQLTEHPRIRGWAKGRIDRYFCSCGRQTMTSGRCGRLTHESSSFWRCRVAGQNGDYGWSN